jgi:hypothetical protein
MCPLQPDERPTRLPERTKPRSRFVRPLQTLAASAVLFLLSLGLCNVGHFNLEGQSSFLANCGVFAFFASLLVGAIAILWLIITSIFGRE